MSSEQSSSSSRLRKLALVAGLVALGLATSWWFAPGLFDRFAHAEVSTQCDGRLALDGELAGQSLGGRHCHTGQSTAQTELGFFVSFEYAQDGQVLLWGRGQPPRAAGESRGLDVAMVRTPGHAGSWLCAAQASWQIDDAGEHQLSLDQVGLLLDEAVLESVGGTLVVDETQMIMEVGHWLATVPRSGSGCDQDLERCTFHGDEQQTIRAFIRSKGPDQAGRGFVVRQNQRDARHVQLSVSANHSPTLVPMKSAQLSELSALMECPLAEPGEGSLTLSWKP